MQGLDRFRLDGRVAMVTGGNRGLGKAIAFALAEAGAQVIVAGRNGIQAQAAAQEMQTATGRTARGYACDMTVPDQITALVETSLKDFGQLDIVVNNAGININRPIEQLNLEEFERVQMTNLTGPWLLCRAVAAYFKERRYGRVINIASTSATNPFPGLTPYASSKAALVQMTRVLALELGSFNVTANAILPGPFATDMNQGARDDPKVNQQFLAMMPLKRWGQPEELGGMVVFLASEAGSFITGTAIPMDGGRSLV